MVVAILRDIRVEGCILSKPSQLGTLRISLCTLFVWVWYVRQMLRTYEDAIMFKCEISKAMIMTFILMVA